MNISFGDVLQAIKSQKMIKQQELQPKQVNILNKPL